jgi:ABC-type branched-subunit amino acid transport system substrate-binding protein
LADERRITMICPAASRDGLSTLGPYIFSDSMTNEMQGRAIARYAVEKLGLKKFAILAPQDVYGQTLADQFQKTVQAMGATVMAQQTYLPGSTDFKKQLVALGGQDPESNKENDRENTRRWGELRYNLGKEAEKVLLKVKDLRDSSGKATDPPVVAFVPMVEGLGNTLCPSVVKDVNDAIREGFKGKDLFTFRTDDIVKQSLPRLPIELKGNTLTATADQWAEVAQDMQANILITGHIVEPTPENDWTPYPNWDYNIHFEAFWVNPKTNQMTRFYQSKIPFKPFKPASLVRAQGGYQALYLPAHAAEVPLLTSQIHFYDLAPVFLGGHLWDNETILQEGAKDMEGSYFVTGFYVDSQQAATKKFVEEYQKKFAKRPDLYAAQAYDAMRLLIQASNLSTTRDDIHTNLMQIKGFDGVSGLTDFGGKNEADKLVPVIHIQGGKYQQVQ